MTPAAPPWLTAHEALARLRSGMRVFIGTGCAAPQTLIDALAACAPRVYDVEVLHLLTHGPAPYARRELLDHFRQNSFFIGPNVREAVHEGLADYTPISLSDIPRLFREKHLHLDLALVQVSPPDRHGFCSLGISVDVVRAAIESAACVIAEVNPLMPRTLGDSFVHVRDLDALVAAEHPLLELPVKPVPPEALRIAEFIETLVPDGATLQTGIGTIPSAILAALMNKRDLGMHTEMLTDAVIPLIEAGVLTGRRKTLLPGKIVTSLCLGTRALYDFVHDNPAFEFRATELTNDPFQIARNRNMIAISSAVEVDLTGQVCADSVGRKFRSGFGGQLDFMRGAARSEGGKPIVALLSTAANGTRSRLVPFLKPGAGVVTTRADVHYVVTEYGIAHLHGKTVRERVLALVHLAHPKFRDDLMKAARDARLVHPQQIALPAGLQPYPKKYETRHVFRDGMAVRFRPIQPADEGLLKELFYAHTPETIYQRYFTQLRHLPHEQLQQFVTLDYRNEMAIVGLAPFEGRERFVGVARYHRNPATNEAEVAVTVHEDYRRIGLATFLLRHLCRVATEQGILGFTADVLSDNHAMIGTFQKVANPVEIHASSGVTRVRFHLADVRPTRTAPPVKSRTVKRSGR